MSISIKINSGEDRPFTIDLERLPTEIGIERNDVNLSFVPFGLFLLAAVFFVLQEFSMSLAFSVVLPLGAVMAFVFMRMMARSGRKNIIRFEKNGVVVTEVGLMSDKHWQADYSEFKGVYMRRRIAKSGRTNSTYQVIELKHQDESKTLPLYVDLSSKAPTSRWQSYADLFNLPAVKEGY